MNLNPLVITTCKMPTKGLGWALALTLAFAGVCVAQSTPPDLTAPGVIASIDRSRTYNLGPTGLRGWMHVDPTFNTIGRITDKSRQILVTVASSPGNAVLAVDDVILGAVAADSGTVPSFTSDARKAFGAAITDAEQTGSGTLRLKRWRAGVTSDVNITIPTLGEYSATAPYNCPKSSAILAGTRVQMVGEFLADPNYLKGSHGHANSIHALALLASVQPGDPNYAAVQTRLQTYARSLTSPLPNSGAWNWGPAYQLIFLSEYYLLTGDAQVVPTINATTLWLTQSQSMFGTFGHGPSILYDDGSGNRVSTGYGPVNAVGNIANIGILLGKKALQAASQPVDPEIDAAIQRAAGFLGSHVNKGSIQYGEHLVEAGGHASNGKDASAAAFFALQNNKAVEAEYFARTATAGWIGLEEGHAGQELGLLWSPLGAAMGGDVTASEYFKQLLWRYDIQRRSNGSFTYDSRDENWYNGGSTADGTYLGRSEQAGLKGTAIYLLTYSLPLKRLLITGRDANPAYALDAAKAADAVFAGAYLRDYKVRTTPELFYDLGAYDPTVRHWAAKELAVRSLSGTDLDNLRALLTSPDSNLRQSAAHSLGVRKDAAALPTLVGMLRDPHHWVRFKAAAAILNYPSTAISPYRNAIMEAFIANAPADPSLIDWTDPLQFSNGELTEILFGTNVYDRGNDIADETLKAPRETHLYPALRVALQLPTGYYRSSVSGFIRDRLGLTDLQALYPELARNAAHASPADPMFSSGARASAIGFLAENEIKEGIPLALAMLEGHATWGSGHYRTEALKALASYGDAARYTLPILRGYLETGGMDDGELLRTITTIENAVAAPAIKPGLCGARSQVVATTGATTITLTGMSPRGSLSYLNITQPIHGTLTGTAPSITYTPNTGYSGPDQFTFQTADSLTISEPATVSIIVGSAGAGLAGEYFDNADFTGPVLSRVDPQVNFDWGAGSPDPSIGIDTFSVHWDGLLRVPESGAYIFSTLNNDGVRLNINGQAVIDDYVSQTSSWIDGIPVQLTAGEVVDLQMFYYHNTGPAVAKLKWTGPSFAGPNGDFISSEWLYEGAGMPRTPYAHSQSVTLLKNTSIPIKLTGSGGALAYTVTTVPAHGSLTGSAPNLTYTPDPGYSGPDQIIFGVNNGSSDSVPAAVLINVQEGLPTSIGWAQGVSGNWSTAASWTPGLPAADGLPFYALNFTASGTYTATHDLNDGFQLNQLNTAANVTLAGSKSLSFVANGGTHPRFNHDGQDTATVNHPVTLQAMTTWGGGGSGTVILAGRISGTGGITKNSFGDLKIAQNNSYSGGTIINGGTLTMEDQKNTALGTGPVTLNRGVLKMLHINARNPLTVNGGRIWADGGWGGSWSGPVTLNGDLTVSTPYYDNVSISGNISGTGGLTADGVDGRGGAVHLTGINMYTGRTTVRDGARLRCSRAAALGSGPLEIGSQSKLELAYSGTKVIASLTLEGAVMPAGNYGSMTSPATQKSDTWFSGSGTVTVLANSAPVASSQSVNTTEDVVRPINLSATDADGQPLTYSIVRNPAHGMLRGTPPNVVYAPFLNYIGPDSFSFQVNDGSLDSAVATVDITVTPGNNDEPVALPQSLTTPPNTSIAVTLSGLDAEGDALTYALVTAPGSGTLSGIAPNFIYSPATNYTGSDRFTFKVNDGTSDSAAATVSITIASGTYRPGLWYGTVAGNINTTLPNPKSQVTVDLSQTENSISENTTEIYTGEIYDADGRISFTENIDDKTRLYINGRLVLSSDDWSDRRSTPDLNLTPGWHRFELRISNGGGGSGPVTSPGFGYDPNGGTVWRHPSDPGDGSLFRCSVAGGTAPVASAQSVTTSQDTPKLIALSGTDAEGSLLTYAIVTPPGNGTLSGMLPHVTYTPAANYSGSDSFTFKVNDGLLDSAVANVTITVTPGNDPPPTDYVVWAAKFPGANLTDPNADFDGDGLTNNDERIWGLDPTKAASRNPFNSLTGLTHGTFSYTRRVPSLTGLRYTVWTSTNLTTWTEDPGAVQTPGAALVEVETVSSTVSPALVTGAQLYLQMRASQP
jgi:autotransporter-associated beta strand protein